MSAEPMPERSLNDIARKYITDVLTHYENGSFALFERRGRIYAGVSQPLAVFQEKVLVRVIKIPQPPPNNLLDVLIERCKLGVLEVDSDIEFEGRNLFYACLHEETLHHLSPVEQSHLTTKELF